MKSLLQIGHFKSSNIYTLYKIVIVKGQVQMPELDIYPVPLYEPQSPYHWEYDNLPLKALKLRDEVINGQVDINTLSLAEAAGNQGSVSNRLNQSIEENGDLKTSAIDEALHNIAEHEDGSKTLTAGEISDYATKGYVVSNPVPFVRMISAERDKLSLIADEATNMSIQVETPSTVVLYTEGPITFKGSASVTWEVTGSDIKANMAFPIEAAHRHYYDLEPITTDYLNFQVTSVSTPYVEGSLRVYVNGVRLSSEAAIYVPSSDISAAWTANMFSADQDAGTFFLQNAITSSDVIRIDFDIALA